jgi:pheromone shutdown-related protein TraB
MILSAFQKKIGETTGMKPGQEMIEACNLAESGGKDLALVDREIRITLSRAWGKVSLWNKMWLGSNLAAGLLVKEDVAPEEIERLKQEDVLSDLFSNLPPKYNIVKEVIVDERDRYLAENIRRTAVLARSKNEERILAVVGAGHLKGIEETLKKQISVDLEELNVIPAKNNLRTILFWVIFSAVIGALSLYIGTGGTEAAKRSLTAWILGRSLGAGIGAIIARAHPLTILVTILMAPISVFIPGSRLWMFSAFTELWLKKPRVEDFENIAPDTDTMRSLLHSLYNNRVLKLFLIISLVSFGLTLGNIHFWIEVIGGIFRNLH